MIGDTVGHYKILEQLGAGGMGEVWLAEDTRLERKVAIKFLPHHAAQEEAEKARFIQEAKAAARLTHNNIAQVYEIGEEEGRLYIVMEYVSGGSLRDQLDEAKGRSLPLNKVLTWVQEAAQGLAEAHKQGIIHRDIKPDNLMLTESGQIKITDFGLARLETATRLTAEGATLGTVNYMSPEQIIGRDVDHRADLFSLGATFFELLTGHRVFEGADANATYFAILNDTIEPLSRFLKEIPEGLEAIIQKLLEKDPGIRYQSSAEIVSDLNRLFRSTVQEQRAYIDRRTLREYINSIHPLSWTTAGLLIISLIILSLPSTKDGRKYLNELLFAELAARDGQLDYPAPISRKRIDFQNSIFLLPYSKLLITRDKILSKLEPQLSSRSIDAYIATALLTAENSSELCDQHLEDAIQLSPTDARIIGLRAFQRNTSWGLKDTLGYQLSRRAYSLDPDNAAYAMAVSRGALAHGNVSLAEEMLLQAASAPKYESNWSRHFGAIYRSLRAIQLLRPTWQAFLLHPGYQGMVDAIKVYLGVPPRDISYWPAVWEKPVGNELLRRAKIIESISIKMMNDKTGTTITILVGIVIQRIALEEQLSVLPANSIESEIINARLENVEIYQQLILPSRDYTRLRLSNAIFPTFIYAVLLYIIYIFIGTVICVYISALFDRYKIAYSSYPARFIMTWLIMSWIPILFLPTGIRPSVLLVGILILLLLCALLVYSCIASSSTDSSPRRFFRDYISSVMKHRLLRFGVLAAIVGIVLYAVPETFIINVYTRYTDSSLLPFYSPLLLPGSVIAYLCWVTFRKQPTFTAGWLYKRVLLVTSIFILISATIISVQSITIHGDLQRAMEVVEPSALARNEFQPFF